MRFHSPAHATIAFGAILWEFIMPHRQPKNSPGIPAKENFALLEASLSKAYPVTKTPCFDDLLTAIDEADLKIGMNRQRNV